MFVTFLKFIFSAILALTWPAAGRHPSLSQMVGKVSHEDPVTGDAITIHILKEENWDIGARFSTAQHPQTGPDFQKSSTPTEAPM